MKRPVLALLMIAGIAAARRARAEEACKTVTLKNPAPTLSEIYGMAEKHARAWKADAVPARITNTSLGPLQPNGASAAWNLMFYSPQADAHVAINTFRGSLTCWADKGEAGRIPDLKPGFFRDGAALYALAKQHGGTYLDQGYVVSLGTAAAPSDRHATWYINYEKEGARDAPLTVIVDANTGKLEKVMKD
jgi:hypothetical protein